MRIPKRCNVGGLITKALKRGIFKHGPQLWARINRENKVGWFNSESQAKLGAKGGKSRSAAKVSACRKNGAKSGSWRDSEKQAERGRRIGAVLRGDPVYAEMQRWRAHLQWHVRRGVANPTCPFCKKP